MKTSVTVTAQPRVSVIIASFNARETIADCLRSLEVQQTDLPFEIIVVDSSTDDTGEVVEREFPAIRLLRFAERKYPGAARNAGIAAARGELIAFLDADCRAEPDWLAQIVKAHQSPHLVVGGPIANGNPESLVGWAAYLCEFHQWMPGTPTGWWTDLPTANLSYKREVFSRYGEFLEGTYCSDSELHWRMAKDGQRLLFLPSIRVSHSNIEQLDRYLRHELFHGRSFARVRVRAQGFSAWRRLAYIAGSPLIAAKNLLRAVRFGLRSPEHRIPLVKASLPLVAGILCWAAGEAAGYARGAS